MDIIPVFLFNSMFIVCLFTLSGCSYYLTRFYSYPHGNAVTPSSPLAFHHYNWLYLSEKSMPSVFSDSLLGTRIELWLDNEYMRECFGPPLIPLVTVWSGYGYDRDELFISSGTSSDVGKK